MKIRPFNIDRMRRHAARSTPDFIIFDLSVTELQRIGDVGGHRLLRSWMDKMQIKHVGKMNRIELFQEYLGDRNAYKISARVVKDQYDHTSDSPHHQHGGTDAPECTSCTQSKRSTL